MSLFLQSFLNWKGRKKQRFYAKYRWKNMSTIVCNYQYGLSLARCNNLYYNQTPLLWTRLGPEEVSVLRSVVIKRVNSKENAWGGTKKTVRNNEMSVLSRCP